MLLQLVHKTNKLILILSSVKENISFTIILIIALQTC